jgi:tetratricopeptide (TPR) repeat protein
VHGREFEVSNTAEEAREAMDRMQQALARALELDPGLAIAHSRMAYPPFNAWDFEAAVCSTERALAADPRHPLVMGNAAELYKGLGRLDEAIALGERAHEVDPLGLSTWANLAQYYALAGQLDKAEELLRGLLQTAPDFEQAHRLLFTIHLSRGDAARARVAHERAAELLGRSDSERERLFREATVDYTAGNTAGSATAATEFEKRFGFDQPIACAGIRAWRGEADLAFAWLNEAFASHASGLAWVKANLFLRPLRTDPRWNELMTKIGLPADGDS